MRNALILFLSMIIILTSCAKEESSDFYPLDQDVVLRNIKYGHDELQSMDVYLPSNRSPENTKAIVYIHAGDWSSGDKDDFSINDHLVNIVKEHLPGFALFSLNHRLTETNDQSINHSTDAEMDILKAMDYIYNNAQSYHISTHTYMIGVEAGAQLASLYTLKSAGVTSHVKGCIAISSAFDLTSLFHDGEQSMQEALHLYIGGLPSDHHLRYQNASPIQFISSASPPFLIIHDNENTKFPVAQAEQFAHSLATQGVEHHFHRYHSIKDSVSSSDMEKIFTEVKKFLQQ